MSKNKNHTAQLGSGMQALEDRRLMAVDAFVSGGDLVVSGDGGSDQIEIYRQSNGQVRVQALSGSGTTVNGGSGASFSMSDDIWLDLGSGNNTLRMRNYNGGINADFVRLRGGWGNDTIDVNGINTRSDLVIETRGGGDHVIVSNSMIGNGANDDLRIKTGAQADRVDVFGTTVRQDVDIDTFDNVNTYENDVVDLEAIFVYDDLYADLGNGADALYILNSTVLDNIDVDSGNGSDDLFLHGTTVYDHVYMDTHGGNDDVDVRDSHMDDLRVNLGNDHDNMYIEATLIDRDLYVDAGSGNDDLTIKQTHVKAWAKLYGQSGSDDLIQTQFTVEGGKDWTGW